MAYSYQQQQVLLPSAARTTNVTSPFSVNGYRNVRLDIDITAFTGTSITFKVQYYDIAKAAYVDTGITTAALSATGHTILNMGQEIQNPASGNLAGNMVLPPRLQLVSTGTITSVTFSVLITKQS